MGLGSLDLRLSSGLRGVEDCRFSGEFVLVGPRHGHVLPLNPIVDRNSSQCYSHPSLCKVSMQVYDPTPYANPQDPFIGTIDERSTSTKPSEAPLRTPTRTLDDSKGSVMKP